MQGVGFQLPIPCPTKKKRALGGTYECWMQAFSRIEPWLPTGDSLNFMVFPMKRFGLARVKHNCFTWQGWLRVAAGSPGCTQVSPTKAEFDFGYSGAGRMDKNSLRTDLLGYITPLQSVSFSGLFCGCLVFSFITFLVVPLSDSDRFRALQDLHVGNSATNGCRSEASQGLFSG